MGGVYNSANSGISNVVEDTTPQLGGDLDLNGNNIDFPSTANISDCLDEDTMTSDSNTSLATQQSIKAYVDNSASIGEVNTASNTGTSGTGLFKQKSTFDLELYKLNSVNNRLTVALDGTDKIDLTINEANIDHDALNNYVANEHIDWTAAGSNFSTTGTLVVDGSTDTIQMRVQGHSTQTNEILVVENSAGTDLFTVNNSGNLVVAGTVDGRDIATDGTKLDGIESNATADQTDEEIQDIVGAMLTGNTETLITVTYQDGDGTIDFAVDEASINHDSLTGYVANEHIDWTSSITNFSTTGSITVGTSIMHSGDTNNLVSFGTDTQDFQTGGSSRFDISDSGVRLGGANARVTTVLDEDTMSSDSNTSLATQQSIKAYVDTTIRTDEEIQDIIGTMVTGNTETGITVTYQDGDGTLDFEVTGGGGIDEGKVIALQMILK